MSIDTSKVTPTLGLPQWIAGQKPKFLEDMNDAYMIIDGAYKVISDDVKNMLFHNIYQNIGSITLKSGVTLKDGENGKNKVDIDYQLFTNQIFLNVILYPNDWSGLSTFVLNGSVNGVNIYAYPIVKLPITCSDANKIIDIIIPGQVGDGYGCYFTLAVEDGNVWLCIYANEALPDGWTPESSYGIFTVPILLNKYIENINYQGGNEA